MRAAEQDRDDVKKARAEWAVSAPTLDPGKLVFLDETWATTNMARTHGRAPRGKRLVCPIPAGHWHTTTSLCALRHDGLVAPLVLDGAINGRTFLAYVQQMLSRSDPSRRAEPRKRLRGPTLRTGDTVVMDNLGSHKVAGVREAIEARGASLLHLPAYSPDLNPIELAFSKLKRLLRAEAARTVDALWDAIGRLLDRFGPDECARYIRHCGYAQSGL